MAPAQASHRRARRSARAASGTAPRRAGPRVPARSRARPRPAPRLAWPLAPARRRSKRTRCTPKVERNGPCHAPRGSDFSASANDRPKTRVTWDAGARTSVGGNSVESPPGIVALSRERHTLATSASSFSPCRVDIEVDLRQRVSGLDPIPVGVAIEPRLQLDGRRWRGRAAVTDELELLARHAAARRDRRGQGRSRAPSR